MRPSAPRISLPSPTLCAGVLVSASAFAGSVHAQVISVQPTAGLSPAAYAASARAQFGASQPANYLTAVLGGAQITTDQQAAIVAQGGFTASSNPPFWAQGANNTFRLSYSAVTQRLTLTIFQPGGAVQAVINDVVNFAGANGLNLNFAGLNASFFGGLTLTSAGQTVAIGPGGDWSGTSLENATLTGWNLAATWRIDGYLRFLQPGQDALPRLQFDVLNPGLGYQLSDQGSGRPAVINYGRIQDMVVVDGDFAQAQFGGTDGVIIADILSRAAVTFDVATDVEFSGGIFDLDSPLVAPADFGTASLVKRGVGRLDLTGTSAYSGTTTIEDGILGITRASQLGADRLVFGDGSGTTDPILATRFGAAGGTISRDIETDAADIQVAVETGTATMNGTIFADAGTDFVKLGAGTLVLDTAGSYDGQLRVDEGTAVMMNTGVVGDAGIRMGTGALVLGTDYVSTLAQDLDVAGNSVIRAGAGDLFSQRGAFTSDPAVTLRMQSIDFRLLGDGSGFVGTAELDAGASFLMSAGSLGGSLDATSASSIDATGSVAGNVALADSILRASGGDSTTAGTLSIGGDLSIDAGSTYFANVFLNDVAPNVRASDRIDVTGSVSQAGTVVAVLNRDVSPGDLIPAPGETRTWQLITSTAGTGAFDVAQLRVVDPTSGTDTTINLPINGTMTTVLVRYSTVFDATGASITLFGLSSLPPDQLFNTSCGTVSGAEINDLVAELQRISANGTADAAAVADALLLGTAEQIPPSYTATQQRNPYADPDVILDSNAMAGRVAMLRLMQQRDGAIGGAAAKAADASNGRAPDVAAQAADQPYRYGAPLNGPTPDEGARAWMRGYGFYEDIDPENCAECGYDASIGAAMVGADWAIDGGGIVGAFAGLGPGVINYDVDYGSQSESVTQAMVGLYGSLVPGTGGMYVQGFALGGYYDIDRTRITNIPGINPRTAESSNEAWSLSAGGELGLNLNLGERTYLQPFAGVTWGQYWGNGYNETGAGSLNLQVQGQSANEWQPTAGARLMHAYNVGTDVISPFIGAAFLAQLPVGAGWAPVYTSEFNLNEATQLATGPEDRYGVSFQAGLEFARISGATAYIAFDGAVLTGKQRFGGQVGVMVPF